MSPTADIPARLMLITPELAEVDAFEAALSAALGAGDVAAVVIRLAKADERTLLARAKVLVALVQAAGAAALLAGEGVEEIVGKSGADGLHVTDGEAAVTEALERFKPEKIVGAGALRDRDAAMSAGEGGADYVLFGDGGASAQERVDWWAPIFEVPCVGLAETLDDVAPLAAARAEFVALGDVVWRAPTGPAAAVADAERSLSLARAPTP